MKPVVHPNWLIDHLRITDGYSLEVTAKDIPELEAASPYIWHEAPIAVPFLPGETNASRIAAARAVRARGFEPMPHLSARRIVSYEEFDSYLKAVVREAGVQRCFVVAGDPPQPAGPFADSGSLIATGAFEAAGIKVIGIGGHPDGHPVMTKDECWQVLEAKTADIEARGMAALIVTQFSFDAGRVLTWLKDMRSRGLDQAVRIGVPGPAGIKTLMRYAAFCGVGASSAVLRKYGISLGNLIGSAGPDRFVDQLTAGLGPEHGRVRLHFFPFGGIG
ncbi:MAG: methylenetetrahydrofolate reductase, partial [Alphaproteobacteria bacterium]|nr:methylenetetrahydrofolate reductase [Alphaproteobacteria bacterium]